MAICFLQKISSADKIFSPNDFYLLNLLDVASLSDYKCAHKKIHWYFCSNFGMRCEEKMTKVWSCKEKGWKEGRCYLSINAQTIEAGQEGLDLRDKKWIASLHCKDGKEEDRYNYPQEGGTCEGDWENHIKRL